jgi:hypothetical protein
MFGLQPPRHISTLPTAGNAIDVSEWRLWGRFEPLARGRGRSMISTGREWLHRVGRGHLRGISALLTFIASANQFSDKFV